MEWADKDVYNAFIVTQKRRFQPAAGLCKPGCPMWEHRPSRSFVCTTHYRVHRCGPECKERVLTVEGEVCAFTGHVVGGPAEMYHWQRTSGFSRVKQTHAGVSSCQESAVQVKNTRLAKLITTAVEGLLLPSHTRTALRTTGWQRIQQRTRRLMRNVTTFKELHEKSLLLIFRHKAALTPGASNRRQVSALAAMIVQYAQILDLAKTKKTVIAFAAAMVQLLAKGLKQHGDIVIPRLPFVAAHAPPELAHNTLIGVQCRAVSNMLRQIVDAVNTGARQPFPSLAV